ncbi:MAG: DUF2075 domain-containing protein [Coxiellaceae bacterium]|nr:DUF2075 domain-containing protein [Coxiellaceae bacterium]
MSKPIIVMSNRVKEILATQDFINNNMTSYLRRIQSIRKSEISHGANLERVGRVLSLRIGKKGRLLATKKTIKGQLVWVLLELLPNHEYQKAYYLKPGMKERLLEDNEDRIMALAASGDYSNVLDIDNKKKEAAQLAGAGGPTDFEAPEEVIEYNNQLIHLTDKQDECLFKINTGLTNDAFLGLVAGAPGSGKTLLAKEILQQVTETDSATENAFYVAESANLRREMATQCESLKPGKINYFNYEQMLRHARVDIDHMTAVDDSDLVAFFSLIQDEANRLVKIKTTDDTTIDRETEALLATMSFAQFRQECIVISGIKKSDDGGLIEYQTMGGNHSLFHGNARLQRRLWIYFQQYNTKLTEANQYHPQLSRFTVDKMAGNPIIVVDEALDLTRVQLQTLAAMGVRIIFVGDHNQDLENTSHSMEYLRNFIATSGVANTYIGKLNQTYRCSTNIVAIANALLDIKKTITSHGSKLVDIAVDSAIETNGLVAVTSTKTSDLATIRRLCNTTDTAVICPAAKKAAVSEELSTALTFTIAEIKGLGYKRIILRDLISKHTAQRLLTLHKSGKKKRGDITAEDKTLITDLNNLFTAISRAEVELVFMTSDKHPAIHQLIDLLIDGIDKTPIDELGIDTSDPTIADWIAEAQRLQSAGNTKQAKDIARQFGFTLCAITESAPHAKPAVSGELESKEAPPITLPTDLSAIPAAPSTHSRKPSKKKKYKKARARPTTAPTTTPPVPSKKNALKNSVSKGNKALTITFKEKLPKAEKSKKGKKGKHHTRTIDFSQPLSLDNLTFLAKLNLTGCRKIGFSHLLAILAAPISDTDCTQETKDLYLKAFLNIIVANNIRKDRFGAYTYSLINEINKLNHLNTAAFKIFFDPAATDIALQRFMLFILIQLAHLNPDVHEILAKLLVRKDCSGCSTASYYVYDDIIHFEYILQLAPNSPSVCKSLIATLDERYESKYDESYSDADQSDYLPKPYEITINDTHNTIATVAQFLILNRPDTSAITLCEMADNNIESRKMLISALETPFSSISTSTTSKVCLLHAVVERSPDLFITILNLAKKHNDVLDMLLRVLLFASINPPSTKLLHDILRRHPECFTVLTELSKKNNAVLNMLIQGLLKNKEDVASFLNINQPVFIQLAEIALYSTTFADLLFKKISITYATTGADDTVSHASFVIRCAYKPECFKAEYPFYLQLAKKYPSFRALFMKSMPMTYGSNTEHAGKAYNMLHDLAECKPDIFIKIIEDTIEHDAIEYVIPALQMQNTDGKLPMQLLEQQNAAEHTALEKKLEPLVPTDALRTEVVTVSPAANPHGLFTEGSATESKATPPEEDVSELPDASL